MGLSGLDASTSVLGSGYSALGCDSSNNSPDGRTACSACHSADRLSYPNALSAPMSASATSSSRRRPLRDTRSSIDAKRAFSYGAGLSGPRSFQSKEQLLQKPRSQSISIIDASSQPHFGHLCSAGLSGPRRGGPERAALQAAIAFPTSLRRPCTYLSPRRIAPSCSTVQFQSEICTSMG